MNVRKRRRRVVSGRGVFIFLTSLGLIIPQHGVVSMSMYDSSGSSSAWLREITPPPHTHTHTHTLYKMLITCAPSKK